MQAETMADIIIDSFYHENIRRQVYVNVNALLNYSERNEIFPIPNGFFAMRL